MKQLTEEQKAMKDQFVPYKQSLELKELGFNEPCFESYKSDSHGKRLVDSISEWWIKKPLWQQAFDWFRTEHKLMGWVVPVLGCDLCEFIIVDIKTGEELHLSDKDYTYEEARLALLDKLIEIVKENKS